MSKIDFLLKYQEFHENPFTTGKIFLDLLSISFVIINCIIWLYYVPGNGCVGNKVSIHVIMGCIAYVLALIGLGWLGIRAARASKWYKIFSPFSYLITIIVIVEFLKNCNSVS